MGTVDAASGNLHLEIPLGYYPQRGGSTTELKIAYDSHIWSIQPGSNPFWMPYNAPLELLNGGWYVSVSGAWLATTSPQYPNCTFDQEIWSPNGTAHWFHVNLGTGKLTTGCSGSSTNTYALDSSGFELFATYSYPNLTFTLYAPDGTLVLVQQPGSNNSTYPEDTNGNYMSGIFGGAGSGTDTLGRQFLQLPTSPTSCLFTSVHPGGQYYACYNVLTSEGTTSYQQYKLAFADIPLRTNFQWSGVGECTTNCWTTVLTGIGLPDGSSYSFQYDCDSSTGISACNSSGQSAYYGTLTSMTLPTGAKITYGYTMFGGVSWGNSNNEFPSRWLTSKSSGAGTWTYTPAVTAGAGSSNTCLVNYEVGCMQTTVNRPDGSKEVDSFIVDPLGGSWPQETQSYDTDGATLLSTVNNTWDFSNQCSLSLCFGGYDYYIGQYGYQDVRKLTTSTTLPVPGGSITKQTKFTYDTPQTGNITAVQEWKYQSGTAPTFSAVPDRATYVTYAPIGGINNINRPASTTVCNNVGTSDSNCSVGGKTVGGTTVARTVIAYDTYGQGNSLALKDVPTAFNHDDTHFGTAYTTRGNATQISRWVSGSTYLTTTLSYDATGQVIKAVDPNSNASTYSYTDVFYDDNGTDPPATHSGAPTTNAYLTTVTDTIGSTSMGYYYGSGKPASSTDYNGQTTYAHYLDPFDRPTETDYPVGWSLNTYTSPTQVDSYAPVGTTTASTSCTSCTHTQALLDSLGRVTTQSLVNNPAPPGQVYLTSVYDGLNRVARSSHPNFGSTDPNDVFETPSYDGLSRSRGVTHPDGESAFSFYGAAVSGAHGLSTQQGSTATFGIGFPVMSVDEGGKSRQEWLDGFGHVIEVDEPTTGPTPSVGSFSVSGADQYVYVNNCGPPACQMWNSGTVTVTINGKNYSASYYGCYISQTSPGNTDGAIASALATAITADTSAVVTATANGSTVSLQSKGTGSNVNYSLSPSSQTTCSQYFSSSAFSASTSGGSLTGGSNTGSILTTPVVTNYLYDALGNLTSVVQGSQTRSYQYDGLSRLTKELTPEISTTTGSSTVQNPITISYVTSAGALCSGNPSNPCTRTAPAPNQTGTATVTTTYTYNTANQLTNKTHSDSTGTEIYKYGTVASNNNVGRLIYMQDPSGSESYSYDTVGRVTQVIKSVGGTNYTTAYKYNTGSQLTQIKYPSGRIVQYSYDNVGHLCEVAATAAANCGTATGPYLTLPSASYDAASRPLSATYGNGVVATASYSPQTAELTSLSYVKGSTTLFGLNYYYQQNSTTCPTGNALGNNGQIQCIADVSASTLAPGASGRSIAYTYDALGRLLTANTAGGTTKFPAWGLSFTYDRYGNRTVSVRL
jgi:YD repeat-containing protein